jgi:hypothetical protein
VQPVLELLAVKGEAGSARRGGTKDPPFVCPHGQRLGGREASGKKMGK